MTKIPGTSLEVYPLCLGGNVFGWSAGEEQSFEVLNRYAEGGGNFIDTADMYSEWAPARLRSDYIDLYYAHEDDLSTPIDETLKAFNSLVQSGKVRYIASSNFSPERLDRSLQISEELGLAHYVATQDLYNLLDRQHYEAGLRYVVDKHNISILPYYSLAKGFLSGKYKRGEKVDSVRAAGTAGYQNEHGWSLLKKIEELAHNHKTTMSAIALAWLRAQPSVSVPIASARTVEQLVEIMPVVTLAPEEIEMLG